MSIKRIVHIVYKDEEEGFEYTFEPVEESIQVEETPDGYKVKYLVRDENPQSPAEWDNDGIFLVHYHRQFWVESKEISEQQIRDYFAGEEEGASLGDEYYIFLVSAYIHSGVVLSLGARAFAGQLPQGHYEFDVSRCGAVLVKKETWVKDENHAEEIAEGVIKEWNMYLSGDVYGCVVETFDKDKNSIDHDSCWGYYGFDYAMEALKNEF